MKNLCALFVRSFFYCVSIGFFLPLVAKASPTHFTEAEVKAIEAFLRHHFTGHDYGIAVGLIDENGSRVICAGHLNRESDQVIDGDTIFEIGSITKTFASLLFLDLVRSGEFKSDARLANHLPDGTKAPSHAGHQITLEHLAAQESGFPFNASNHKPGEWLDSYNAYTTADLHEFLNAHQLTNEPGSQFQYSNVGFSTLGHVMERQTKKDFESLIVERICGPLEMNDTCIRLSPSQKKRRVVGYDPNGRQAPFYRLQVMEAAGSLHSTVNDLSKYLSAQLGLKKSSLFPLVKQTHIIRHTDAGSFGRTAMPWFDSGVYQPEGSDFRGHGGGTFGTSSFIGFDLGKRRGVIVLSNQRVTKDGQRLWIPAGLGWAILQGVSLTPEHGTGFIREHVGLGIGLHAEATTGEVQISKVFSKSPAERTNLAVGMTLKKINDVSVSGKSLNECLNLLKGERGELVRLHLLVPEDNAILTVELKRDRFLTVQ